MGLFSQNATPRHPEPGADRRPTVAELYEDHFKGVVSSVRFFGVPKRDAKDVAQDVFVRVHTSLPSYDPSRSVGPWLKTIAYRTALDHLRSAHSRRLQLAPTEEEMEVTDTASNPEDRALLAQMQEIFVEVLQELGEDQRMVYLMHVKDEIPIPEIAALLEVPENTVRSRLSRARQAVDAGIAQRQGVAAKTSPALAAILVPAALTDAARKGFDLDPAAQAVVWSRLSRLLGLGIIGALAPVSGSVIAAGAALLLAVGGGAGALAHRALGPHAETEPVVRAEQVVPASASTPIGGPSDATASPSAAPPATATASASASGAGPDAGAPDAAATLRAEGAILAKARVAMEREDWKTALRELQRHARIFPHGMLAARREETMRVVLAEISARDGGSR